MPSTNKPIRVLPISLNQSLQAAISSALQMQEKYLLLETAKLDTNLMDHIVNSDPDYILLDFDLNGSKVEDVIDSITLQFPEIVVVVLLPREHIAESNHVILAGARAFLIEPFTSDELLNTLKRVEELVARTVIIQPEKAVVPQLMRSRGTFVVFSPRGGAGCSSVAINLALSLFEQLGEEVLLMDGKLLFGHLDVMLNLRTQNSVSELIAHVGALDESLIRDVVSEHVSGLAVLPSPTSISAGQGIRPDDLYNLLAELQSVYSHIMIDSGNYLNEITVTYMDASNKVILVVNPDIASLRDASQFFEICRTLSYPKDKVLVVVNQYEKREGLSLDDIEKSLQVKVFGTIPWDRRGAMQSINRGVPVVLQRQGSALRKAYEQIAKDLIGMLEKKQSDMPTSKKPTSDVLAKSSRLG